MIFSAFIELFPKLSEPTVKLSELGVSRRAFFHWKDKNVIDYKHDFDKDDIASGVIRKLILLNAYQALWVMMIEELRSLNIDLKSLVALKKFLFSPIQIDLEAENLKDLDDESLRDIIPGDVLDQTEISAETLLEIAKKFKGSSDILFTNISSLLSGVLLLGQDMSLMMFKEPLRGKLGFYVFDPAAEQLHYRSIKQDFKTVFVKKFAEFSIISVPIRPLLARFFEEDALQTSAMALGLYTKNEIRLLDVIKKRAYDRITVYRDSGRNDISFEVTDGLEVRGELARELRRCIGLKEYQRAEVVYRNDSTVYMNRTMKYKPK